MHNRNKHIVEYDKGAITEIQFKITKNWIKIYLIRNCTPKVLYVFAS